MLGGPEFETALDEKVPEPVGHEWVGGLGCEDRVDNLEFLIRRRSLEFLLQVDRGLLVCRLQDTIHAHLQPIHMTKREEVLISYWYGTEQRASGEIGNCVYLVVKVDGLLAVTTVVVPVRKSLMLLLSRLRRLLLLVRVNILLVNVLGVKSCTMTHRTMLVLSSRLCIISISGVYLGDECDERTLASSYIAFSYSCQHVPKRETHVVDPGLRMAEPDSRRDIPRVSARLLNSR